MEQQPCLLLGLDCGGTKTEVMVESLLDGRRSHALGPGSNYQGTGIAAARGVWERLFAEALDPFGGGVRLLAAAGLGVAGLDRDKDEQVIRPALQALLPDIPMELVNDAWLVLRAGTPDGVGVAVISGTGCNAAGTGRDGSRFRVGGFGPEFGDLGSGSDIAIEALRRAFRSLDGRGRPTAMVDLLCRKLGLQRLDDLVDFFLFDHRQESGGQWEEGHLAPLVFEAAAQGDREAIGVLEWAGRELGIAGRAVARRLFRWDDEFTLVMGGSVLQRPQIGVMRDVLLAEMKVEFPRVQPVILDRQPALGAVEFARDIARRNGLIASTGG